MIHTMAKLHLIKDTFSCCKQLIKMKLKRNSFIFNAIASIKTTPKILLRPSPEDEAIYG